MTKGPFVASQRRRHLQRILRECPEYRGLKLAIACRQLRVRLRQSDHERLRLAYFLRGAWGVNE